MKNYLLTSPKLKFKRVIIGYFFGSETRDFVILTYLFLIFNHRNRIRRRHRKEQLYFRAVHQPEYYGHY